MPIKYFLIPFISTFLITRTLTHLLHRPKAKRAYTPTWFIRKKIGKDIHHIHIGFLLVLISIYIYFVSQNTFFIVLAIGLSFIADQILPLLKFMDYFELKGILGAIILHIIIGGIAIIVI